MLGETDGDGLTLGLSLALPDIEGDSLGDTDRLTLGETLGLILADGLTDGLHWQTH